MCIFSLRFREMKIYSYMYREDFHGIYRYIRQRCFKIGMRNAYTDEFFIILKPYRVQQYFNTTLINNKRFSTILSASV